MSNVGPEEIVDMMLTFISDMSEAEKNAMAKFGNEARLHREFITEYAAAWRKVAGPNREYREAMVDDMTKDKRFEYESAKDESKLAYQRMLNVRQGLSALQSAARTVGEDAAFSRTGPSLEDAVTSHARSY